MNLPDHRPDHTWIDERIEAFLDHDLPEAEMAEMERMMAESPGWETHLLLAGQIRDTLRATETPLAPPRMARTILRRTRWMAFLERMYALVGSLGAQLRAAWQPALALTSVALLATFLYLSTNPKPVAAPPQADVEMALAEVKWTLGYISKTGRKAGESVQDALAPRRPESTNE